MTKRIPVSLASLAEEQMRAEEAWEYRRDCSLRGYFFIPHVATGPICAFEGDLMGVRICHWYDQHKDRHEWWVLVRDADDWEVIKRARDQDECREIVLRMPTFLCYDWLMKNGFK